MAAPAFLPSNVLVAAFPAYHSGEPSIRQQEGRERWAARKAEIEASRLVGFQPRIEFIPPTRAGTILGEKPVHRFTGRSGERHTFVRVSSVDRTALVAGPVVLVAIRRVPGRVDTLGVEAFEAESVSRLHAWISRATVARDVELLACSTIGTRIERAAVAADLTDKPARASAFVSAGQYDRRAIMAAAIATAKASRKATGSAFRRRPRPAAGRLAPMDQVAVRAEIEEAAQAALDTVDHLLAILDGMEPQPDDEDGGDAEPDLGAPEGHESQVVWLRGTGRDLG